MKTLTKPVTDFLTGKRAGKMSLKPSANQMPSRGTRMARISRKYTKQDSYYKISDESVERIHNIHNSSEIPDYLVPVKKIQNAGERAKMKKKEKLMKIIKTSINKEFSSCSKIPELDNSEILCKIDRRYRMLRPKLQPRFRINNSIDYTSRVNLA